MFQHPTHILSWVEPLTNILPFTLHIFRSHSLSHRRSARNQNTKGFSHSLTVLSLTHFTSLHSLAYGSTRHLRYSPSPRFFTSIADLQRFFSLFLLAPFLFSFFFRCSFLFRLFIYLSAPHLNPSFGELLRIFFFVSRCIFENGQCSSFLCSWLVRVFAFVCENVLFGSRRCVTFRGFNFREQEVFHLLHSALFLSICF